MSRALLCRYGEIFLKSGNRKRFEGILLHNVRAALAGVPSVRVEAPHGRVVVFVDDAVVDEAAARVRRVFGLVSLSLATVVPADIEAISRAAVAEAQHASARARPASFKVESRRSDKRFPLPSPEVSRLVGAQIVAATGLAVDVHHPVLTIGVEIGTDRAFVYADAVDGPGGLPVGSAGRGLLLLSGGIDSPVAGWLAAKRGLLLDAVYFHSPPYVGEKSKDKVLTLARTLARWQAVRTLTVVGFTDLQKRLRDAGPAELAVVLYRRAMMRIADAVGDTLGSEALVTGENLGQVASQTVQNLAVIDAAARRVVLRPLVTFDKVETTALARRIDTFETSILPFDDCCSLFVPLHPATRARLQDVERAEAKLDMAAEVAAVTAAAERISVAAPSVTYTG
ncbi:MAG TPA: tRNA uracil 4-sulfurtransferase ThiI [Polyangia bacterium]|jgi:thiamine biosynthesis protein ThiI|nr:tRNA uracil 4-sulfurtransferase ThiI [Polyangia bacterium]